MKICFICGEYPPGPQGGIGTLVQLISRRLVQLGHQVKVIGVYPGDKFYPNDSFIDNGVEVLRIREKNAGTIDFAHGLYKQYTQIKNWCDKGGVDIVEAPESRGWFAFWPKMKVPLVIRAHGSETNDRIKRNIKINKFTRMMEQGSYNRADAYSAVSKSAANDTQTTFHLKKPLKVIYNGIEFIPVTQTERKKNTIVFAGTMNENKGVITLIRAAIKLYESVIPFQLDVYGKSTPYLNSGMLEYLTSIVPAGMSGQVKFHGHMEREKLLQVYSQSSIAVFPSQWESFGLGPVEAMMCGCAVIYSDIPPGREIIEEGVNGLLAKPNDAEQFAEKIKLLLADETLREKLGAAAILKVKNTFTLDIMCRELLAFYTETIKNHRPV